MLRPSSDGTVSDYIAGAGDRNRWWIVACRLLDCARDDRIENLLKLDGLAAARAFFSGCMADSDPSRESLWVAHLDDGAHCLHLTRHPGNESGTDFPLRSIIADAAMHKSAGIVLAHNHPSGDPTPSDGDKRATRRLACAAEALDCTIVDHLVFGGDDCSSFRRLGLL